MKKLLPTEYKLYGWVPYNLSGRQMGLQFGHAVARHVREHKDNIMMPEVCEWADNHETFIMLNGGPTRKDRSAGMRRIEGYLCSFATLEAKNQIFHTNFHEPDLNDALSAIVFVASNLDFDKELTTKEEKASIERVVHDLMLIKANQFLYFKKKDLIAPTEYDKTVFNSCVDKLGLRATIMQWYLSQFKLA